MIMVSISNNAGTSDGAPTDSSRGALHAGGLRATSQRALILEIIRQRKGHLDADEVYRQARGIQPNISLSTVYRTLRALKELGMIREVHIDEGHHCYEFKAPGDHHHLICLGCGRVIEFKYPLYRYVKRRVAEARDFYITDTEIRMKGYCAECRQRL